MSKIKKFLIVILIVIIAIIIAIMYIYQKSIYTLDDICQMLNSAEFSNNFAQLLDSKKIPENLKITIYSYSNYDHSNFSNTTYILNNTIYRNAESNEYIINYQDATVIEIDHMNKNIFERSLTPQYLNQYIYWWNSHEKSSFLSEVEWDGINDTIDSYKYCGKETIKGKECIKVSMTNKTSDGITINYYYIDLETNLIIKYETFSGINKIFLRNYGTTIIDYDFNSVTENDILQFDINNYPDYEYYNDSEF